MAFGWALLTFGLWVAAVWLIEGDEDVMDKSVRRGARKGQCE